MEMVERRVADNLCGMHGANDPRSARIRERVKSLISAESLFCFPICRQYIRWNLQQAFNAVCSLMNSSPAVTWNRIVIHIPNLL